ncbi:hypothetical protein GCM10017559_71120 [Streptosporangium longisporum]|uniref:Uncharacterized protein n=1 Tax=Streptosporangium longisporum TaxID=46187 RepID=A0ABP6L9T7_9ACTN
MRASVFGALAMVEGLCLAIAGTGPRAGPEHPSGITALVTPAVVRVEATANVDITLLDHIGELVTWERSLQGAHRQAAPAP